MYWHAKQFAIVYSAILATILSTRAFAQSVEEQAVLAPIHAMFDGMSKRDAAAIRALTLPGGTMVLMRDGKPTQMTFEAFADRVGKPGNALIEERIHDPLVRIDNDLAVVWAPFDFLVDGKVDHCGTDLFNLVRVEEKWMIASVADTGRKDCPTQTAVSPQSMKVLGEVDPRFVSYNVEAVEVTGGRFWAPYKSAAQKAAAAGSNTHSGNQPAGLDSSLFQYRPPIDLSNSKLRKLAAALGPAYVRVSGTWRNATYFQNNDDPPLKTPPEGFNGVLTRAEWKGVVDFAKAVNAEIVASVATSAGTRDANGVWTAVQAKPWLDYTQQIGGHIAAIEFMNEPTLLSFGGVPKGYDAASYGRDAKIFGAFLRRESPTTIYLGPGSAAEGLPLPSMPGAPRFEIVSTDDLIKATGPIFDAFSYHFYSMPSHRCLGESGADPKQVLTSEWLDRDLTVYNFYAKERDTYLPGKNLWLTETGEGSCGGDTWAAQFADSFRLLDQFGSLAQKSVKSIMYNTLASSDYGMLDEETLEPRPNYWAALLWKRTMGTRALDPGLAPAKNVRVYAQCMKDSSGGVTLVVLNMDKASETLLKLPFAGERYTLSAPDLFGQSVLLNGREWKAEPDGTVPTIEGEASKPGAMTFPPLSITFVEMPSAGNGQCVR